MSATQQSSTSYNNRKQGTLESPGEPGEHTSKEANFSILSPPKTDQQLTHMADDFNVKTFIKIGDVCILLILTLSAQ